MTFIPLGKTAKHAKRLSRAHAGHLHVAQEARREQCRPNGDYSTPADDGKTLADCVNRFSNLSFDDVPGRQPSPLPDVPTLTDVVADPRVAPQLTLLELRTLQFDLAMPVSVNAAWRSPTRKEIISGISPERKFLRDEHRQYRTNVISNVRRVMRTAPPLAGRIELRVALHFNNARVCDIDNRVKPLQDALTHAQAYVDDSQIDRLIVERIIDCGQEHCAVTLTEIAA